MLLFLMINLYLGILQEIYNSQLSNIIQMYAKKKQHIPQQIIDEYSEEQSQPLIQQVDDQYEPTEKQVREYAIGTLGMQLPQDQNLLYLAREGLKAPIPQNWTPYQSRDGQIYYKHKITQQKIYQHPTDIEYRKAYTQQKQKMARKNLKSIALKQQQQQQGLLQKNPLGFNNNLLPSNNLHGGLLNNNISQLSNISNQSGNVLYDLDNGQDTIEEQQRRREQEEELDELERKKQKQWKQNEKELNSEHEKKMRKYYDEYVEELDNITNAKDTRKNNIDLLEKQKVKIKNKYEEENQNLVMEQLRVFQLEQEAKIKQYAGVYEQDNQIKLNKLDQEHQSNYEAKSKNIENIIASNLQKEAKNKAERERKLEKLREEYENPQNPEIKKLMQDKISSTLEQISIELEQKLQKRSNELQTQLIEYRRILGMDQSQRIVQLAQKKKKLQALSNEKIEAHKQKILLEIDNSYSNKYEKLAKELTNNKNKQKIRDCNNQRNVVMNDQLPHRKEQINQYYTKLYNKTMQEIHETQQAQKNGYDKQLNNKLSEQRDKHIQDLKHTNGEQYQSTKYANRMLLKQKEQQIKNKEQIVKSLEKQLYLEQKQFKIAQLDKQLSDIFEQNDDQQNNEQKVAAFLRNKFQHFRFQYQSPAFLRNLELYKKYHHQYKEDKKILNQICKQLQKTAFQPNFSNSAGQFNIGSGILIKKYNQDVRLMRENQQKLRKFEVLLKKTEIDSQENSFSQRELKQFLATEMVYEDIALKNEIEGLTGNSAFANKYINNRNMMPNKNNLLNADNDNIELQDIEQGQKNPANREYENFKSSSNSYMNSRNMESALNKHSQFLTSVKNQLNRKLYQVRYDARY